MGNWENVGLPDNFDGMVRLFPLPNLILFPHVIQALHIFEPRYCEMLSDALESDHLITMALLHTGWEAHYQGKPKIADVVCIGRIVSHSPTSDGRHNILLAGIQRARIVEELTTDTLFRQARVELVQDIPVAESEAADLYREELLQIFRSMIPTDAANSKTFAELLTHQLPLGILTDVIAYAVNLPISVKQALLGEASVETRYKLLTENLNSLMKQNEEGSEQVPAQRVFRNGTAPPFSAN